MPHVIIAIKFIEENKTNVDFPRFFNQVFITEKTGYYVYTYYNRSCKQERILKITRATRPRHTGYC